MSCVLFALHKSGNELSLDLYKSGNELSLDLLTSHQSGFLYPLIFHYQTCASLIHYQTCASLI